VSSRLMTVVRVVVLCESVREVEMMNVARVDETKAAWRFTKQLWDHTCRMVSLKCRMILTEIIRRPFNLLKHLKIN